MRAYRWDASALGPVSLWPQSLRTVTRLMLNTHHPMFVWWGPSLACLWNDAYTAFIGPERHPSALGQPAREVWAEIWDTIGPQIEFVMSGRGATWHENRLMPITRHGRHEDAYWTYGYSPIDDDSAPTGVGGVLVVCTETTAQVLAEKRQAERAAARTAERDELAQLFAQAPSFMAMLGGPDHRIELVNQAYLRLIGHRDVLGKTVAEALPEVVAQGYLDRMNEVFQSGLAFRSKGARYAVPTTPGGPVDERFVDFILQPVKTDSGDVTGIFVEGMDTTDRTLAERDLRQTVELLHTIIEAAPCVICAKDAQGRMLIANSAALDLIGKPWSEVKGRTDREFLEDPALAEQLMANDRRVFASGQTHQLEELIGTPGGPWRLYLSTKTPLRDEHGAIIGLVTVSVDITGRKEMERELQEANATLEAQVAEQTAERERIWRHSLDLLGVLDFDGIIQASNPAWEATLGYREDELVGRPFSTLFHPDDRATAFAIIGRLKTKSVRQAENRYRHRDGSWRWISWTAVAEGNKIYAVGRNVTSEKLQAEALAQTADALRQAQKMEAVGQLTGGIAHDFNNMLQGITGGIDLAERRIATGRTEEAQKFLKAAQAAAARAGALTARLLAFGRRQALDPKPIDPEDLVQGIAGLIERTVGPAIQVELQLKQDCWPVLSDRNQLESALLNLAINARDAMLPDGGRLVIETAHVALNKTDTADWEGANPGDYVRITVADTGSGMTPDVLAHAFEPFFTTKPDGQGTGLGLSQLYGFVRQSQGIVRLESEVGIGTAVHLYLARSHDKRDRETNGPAAADSRAVSRTKGTPTVLLVDDEASVRSLAAHTLQELGYEVVEAGNGPDALQIFKTALRGSRRGNGIDLLVADIGLPGGLNGRQLADAVRELDADLPVLLITGYAGDAIAGQGRLGPRMEILGKPFALDALAQRVAGMVADARPASSRRHPG